MLERVPASAMTPSRPVAPRFRFAFSASALLAVIALSGLQLSGALRGQVTPRGNGGGKDQCPQSAWFGVTGPSQCPQFTGGGAGMQWEKRGDGSCSAMVFNAQGTAAYQLISYNRKNLYVFLSTVGRGGAQPAIADTYYEWDSANSTCEAVPVYGGQETWNFYLAAPKHLDIDDAVDVDCSLDGKVLFIPGSGAQCTPGAPAGTGGGSNGSSDSQASASAGSNGSTGSASSDGSPASAASAGSGGSASSGGGSAASGASGGSGASAGSPVSAASTGSAQSPSSGAGSSGTSASRSAPAASSVQSAGGGSSVPRPSSGAASSSSRSA